MPKKQWMLRMEGREMMQMIKRIDLRQRRVLRQSNDLIKYHEADTNFNYPVFDNNDTIRSCYCLCIISRSLFDIH